MSSQDLDRTRSILLIYTSRFLFGWGQQFLDIPKGQCEPGIEPDRVADDFWREAVALKRYRSHPMMLIGDEPQSYPSYRDIAPSLYC